MLGIVASLYFPDSREMLLGPAGRVLVPFMKRSTNQEVAGVGQNVAIISYGPYRTCSTEDDCRIVTHEVLMARFAAGHAEAFEALYDRYEEPLFSFCFRLVGDHELAEDVFQDTFMTVIEQRFRYRDRGRFRSWLFTVAHNTCLDRARLGKRRARPARVAPITWTHRGA